MRDTLGAKVVTYGLLAVFVIMVAVPLFWMVTTAIKTNKELYEDFSYFPSARRWRILCASSCARSC